jgi:putative transposase
MRYDEDNHHRRSIRLKGYDYSQPGFYYITICTKNRECLFGEIVSNEMVSNGAGWMINKWFREIKYKYTNIKDDTFIVMPNHFHGIIEIMAKNPVGADPCVCPVVDDPNNANHTGGEHEGLPLPRIVQWFKTMTTNEYIRGVKQYGWRPFPGKLWQRNYYEHIIRNETELDEIREYILYNPNKWDLDTENPPHQK